MEPLQATTVLVSGASIAGLCTAYWLVTYGFRVTVVERAPYLRPGGQALDVRGPALDVAARMGILDTIRQNSTKLRGMSVREALSGQEIFTSTERTLTGGKLDSPDVEILRDDLCQVLLQAVGQPVTYLFADSITSLQPDETGVEVTFAAAAPQRFDLVIGADGLRSNVRRLVFGPDEEFMRYMGHYVAIFTMPNSLALDHWEVIIQHEGTPLAACIGKEKDGDARTYLGFHAEQPLAYDHRDVAAQKQLVADRVMRVGREMAQLLDAMQRSPNFYFDSVNQVIMPAWSAGRVALVGDAGYSVSVSLGQGTTVAMVGAYVLAGELAAHPHEVRQGLAAYETALRDYVETNQQLAHATRNEPSLTFDKPAEEDGPIAADSLPDFGLAVIPFSLPTYR